MILPSFVKSQNYPSKDEVYSAIKKVVDEGRSQSISIGVYNKGEVYFISYGKPYINSEVEADENTIYELASISKVFVSTVFADMIINETIKPDDKLIKFLPDTIVFNDTLFNNISLEQLASHTSGIPEAIEEQNVNNYWEYLHGMTYEKLFSCLTNYDIDPTKTDHYTYSNYNIALLAYVICKVENLGLEDVFRKYYYNPYDLKSTGIVLTDIQKKLLAQSYLRPGIKTDYWSFENSSCAGAAGLKSSVKDLMIIMHAMFFQESTLTNAINLAVEPVFDSTRFENTKIGYGWHIDYKSENPVIGHGGHARHISTIFLVDTVYQYGIVVLSNSGYSIGDIADYLFDKNSKIEPYKPIYSTKILNELLNQFEGNYELMMGPTKQKVRFYEKYGAYFINNFEVFYQGEDTFYIPEINGKIQFKDLSNNQFKSIYLDGKDVKIGSRIIEE